MGKIILASSSPRRADILRKNGYCYEIIPSPYDEKHTKAVFSFDYIQELAYNKAQAVLPLLNSPSLIIGADTMVVLEDKILGKPKDYANALEMLKMLSGRVHKVVTAIVVIDSETQHVEKTCVTSEVEFFELSDEMIKSYVDNFKPFDKAGGYGIQEMPEGYIKSYKGSLENIIGLCPVALAALLEKFEG